MDSGVEVVFAGHDHIYERLKPQKGVHYFVSGGAGKLARGDIDRTQIFAAGFDQGRHFMLVEVAGDELYFQAISSEGKVVDSGAITQRRDVGRRKTCMATTNLTAHTSRIDVGSGPAPIALEAVFR